MTKTTSKSTRRGLDREVIADHAVRLFERKGYHATSIQDIADELGCTKAALYHYINTKSDILIDIHHRFLARATDTIKERLSADDMLNHPEKSLREFIRVAVELVEDLPGYVKVFHNEMADLTPEQRAQTISERRAYQRSVQDVIENAQHSGRFTTTINPRLATFFFFGAINWLYQWYTPNYEGMPRELLIDQFLELALHGLEGPGGL